MRPLGLVIVSICVAAVALPRARAAVGDNAVGMNVHGGEPELLDACVALGAGWVRMDGNWESLQSSATSFNWWLDAPVANARSRGLEVFISLGYTPAWVPRRGGTDARSGNDVPSTAAEWSAFVRAAVTHYRARGVTHFGLWNEANLSSFFEGSLEEYTDVIVIPGAAAVRAVCADCKVLGPELASLHEWDDYMSGVLARAPGAFDIITHHIYQGFPETGIEIWDGDRFYEVLDEPRFPWSRRSVRQVLDAAGYTGEVWITETGEQAAPDDTDALDIQAIYATRVLEEQLARAWYTHTFFYETLDCRPDQPECPIEGYGFIHARSGSNGTRHFPADFTLKPVFQAVQQFIVDHPEIVSLEPAAACADGIDNDGDGFIDGADRGCRGGDDDDEADDPPRERIDAPSASGLVADGDFADIGSAGWTTLPPGAWRGSEALGDGDLAVRIAGRWDTAALHLAVQVQDDVQDNDQGPAELWLGDSLQLAFDVDESGGAGYDAVDDQELTVARVGSHTELYRQVGPAGASSAFDAVVSRSGSTTSYEVRLTPANLPGLRLESGARLGFSFLVNDADGAGRAGWMEWTPGIGSGKAPYYFGELHLTGQAVPPSTGADGSAEDGGPRAPDGGPGVDTPASGDAVREGQGGDPGRGAASGAVLEGTSCRAVPPSSGFLLVVGLVAAGLRLPSRRRGR